MTKQPKTKMLAIKRKDGTITGYIKGYWCNSLCGYVTIPEE